MFSYTLHPLFGHAAFNIDWGYDGGDGTGMQPDRGHRMAIMSVDGDYTNGHDTDYYFQYGTTTGYGTNTPTDNVSADTAVSENVIGLNQGTTYHYRLMAANSQGTSYGSDKTFQTDSANSSSSDDSSAIPPAAPSSGGGGCFIWTVGE